MHHYVDPLTMIFRLADEWFNRRLADGGPVYAEYHPENIIVEPWNAASSLFMIIPAVYWFLRLRKSGKIHAFVLFALLMVFLGGLGSTLFHAFRMSKVFLMLDVIPSAVLTLAIGIWFWLKILPKWWYVLLIFVPVFLIRFVLFGQLPQHVGINVSYAIMDSRGCGNVTMYFRGQHSHPSEGYGKFTRMTKYISCLNFKFININIGRKEAVKHNQALYSGPGKF